MYRGDLTHLDYWTGHSLPVILVAHLPQTEETFWVHVKTDNVTKQGKGWTIQILKTNRFDASCKSELARIFEGSESQLRLRHLTLDLPLMRHLRDGGKVAIAFEEWVNKSLGRTPIEVFVYDSDGEEALEREWFIYHLSSPTSLLHRLFPWAEVTIDEDYYEDHYDRDYRETWEQFDNHGNPVPDPNRSDSIYPYSEGGGGEVEYYRVVLELNDLGKAFLALSEYLNV